MAKLSVTTRYSAVLLALALCAWAAPAAAQDEAEESQAPQILTSDLARRHVLTEDRISVDFVIVDSDNIVRVTINGEPQQFTPSDTVLITKEFVFTEDRTVIEVTATDEQGNERVRKLLRQDITIQADPRTNSLMVMAPSGSIAMLEAMIRDFDKIRPIRSEIRLFPLVNSDAENMVDRLEELFDPEGGDDDVRSVP
ncbi:MAG: hypothetical protein IIA41_02210 [SAR324 cluster bacterium]|nr:hypothetical protein [SAR324 cluster bacterium]